MLVLYIHVQQPLIESVSLMTRIREYSHIDRPTLLPSLPLGMAYLRHPSVGEWWGFVAG